MSDAAGKKTSVSIIRLSPEDKSAIQARAEAAGLSLSEYVRKAALEKEVLQRFDQLALSQIKRIGANLNQIARKINQGEPVAGELAAALEITLRAIDEELKR